MPISDEYRLTSAVPQLPVPVVTGRHKDGGQAEEDADPEAGASVPDAAILALFVLPEEPSRPRSIMIKLRRTSHILDTALTQ